MKEPWEWFDSDLAEACRLQEPTVKYVIPEGAEAPEAKAIIDEYTKKHLEAQMSKTDTVKGTGKIDNATLEHLVKFLEGVSMANPDFGKGHDLDKPIDMAIGYSYEKIEDTEDDAVPITRIILDLDDVLNVCTMSVLKYQGCDVNVLDSSSYPSEVGYDMVAACNNLLGEDRYTLINFWERVPQYLWATFPKSVECDYIVNRCVELVGEDNIFIATSPTKCTKCLAGKLEWIWDHLPPWMHRQYAITPRKWLAAGPGVLLIDDSQDNCDLFRQHGGQALLMPRPWNPNCGLEAGRYLRSQLTESNFEKGEFNA